eukprot:TRINITY_DN81126_c0_g1_i1.p1 TRINITY_DN81126_c0_g1~~TRINITY_DN81126_c0_g1_i1.p1  ORF type:complete len:547 (-),score=141.83 TRINITY_DN81126_c0_g1_i1:46-1686(-)
MEMRGSHDRVLPVLRLSVPKSGDAGSGGRENPLPSKEQLHKQISGQETIERVFQEAKDHPQSEEVRNCVKWMAEEVETRGHRRNFVRAFRMLMRDLAPGERLGAKDSYVENLSFVILDVCIPYFADKDLVGLSEWARRCSSFCPTGFQLMPQRRPDPRPDPPDEHIDTRSEVSPHFSVLDQCLIDALQHGIDGMEDAKRVQDALHRLNCRFCDDEKLTEFVRSCQAVEDYIGIHFIDRKEEESEKKRKVSKVGGLKECIGFCAFVVLRVMESDFKLSNMEALQKEFMDLFRAVVCDESHKHIVHERKENSREKLESLFSELSSRCQGEEKEPSMDEIAEFWAKVVDNDEIHNPLSKTRMVAQKFLLLASPSLRKYKLPNGSGFNVSDDLTEDMCQSFLVEKMACAQSLNDVMHEEVEGVFNDFLKQFIELSKQIIEDTEDDMLPCEIPFPVMLPRMEKAKEARESEEHEREIIAHLEALWDEEGRKIWFEGHWSDIPFVGPEPWNHGVGGNEMDKEEREEEEEALREMKIPVDADVSMRYVEHMSV